MPAAPEVVSLAKPVARTAAGTSASRTDSSAAGVPSSRRPGPSASGFLDNKDGGAELGFFVFASEDYGILLGLANYICGFYEANWMPLYELRRERAEALDLPPEIDEVVSVRGGISGAG